MGDLVVTENISPDGILDGDFYILAGVGGGFVDASASHHARPNHRRARDGNQPSPTQPRGRASLRPRSVCTPLLEDYDIVASFGSTGDAYDNAAWNYSGRRSCEAAWIHQCEGWSSRGGQRGALFDHIEEFYNRDRHQAGLDHRTPSETYTAALVACQPKPRVHKSGSTP
jgi:hypothetical protein